MKAVCVLLLATGTAYAESSFFEYGPQRKVAPAEQLVEASCDIAIDLKGTIADVGIRQRIVNPGSALLAPIEELELPAGANLIAVNAYADRGKPNAGVIVQAASGVDVVSSEEILGPDPAFVTAIPTNRTSHNRYRAQLLPLDTDHEITLELRWTAIAEVRHGAIRIVVPGRASEGAEAPCRGVVRATPGPGATVTRIRIGGADTARAGNFVLGTSDVTIEVELAYSSVEPLVWTQTQSLGEGWSAQAVTVIAPPARATERASRRALLVIDGSRSMELVGRQNVAKVVHSIGAALPTGTDVEAILYDRTAVRVLGGWKPADAVSLGTIDNAITKHAAVNGTDPVAALQLAHEALDDGMRGQAMVILISDGSFASLGDRALVNALGRRPADVDVHAIVLDPAKLTSSGEDVLRGAVEHDGGSYVEVSVDELDDALVGLDSWLKPSLVDLGLHGTKSGVPRQLLAGYGYTRTAVTHEVQRVSLSGRGEHAFSVAARAAPTAAIAQLALASSNEDDFVIGKETTDKASEIARQIRARLLVKHPSVTARSALAVLTGIGKVARTRREMVSGGGPYTRMIALADPGERLEAPIGPTAVQYSPIDKVTLQRLFRDQLRPRAFTCYQRALGKSSTLAGAVRFDLEVGRGEVIRATVTGLGNDAFDACLTDAAYSLELTLPDPATSLDDLTVAHYPLTFSIQEQHPFIVAGDADSSSPLDIDAIKGGVPRRPVRVDTSTPLGNLRP